MIVIYRTNCDFKLAVHDGEVINIPLKIIYIPSENILIHPDKNINPVEVPNIKKYTVLKGNPAEETFINYLKKSKSIVEIIERPSSIVKWAKSKHQGDNPSKGISDILEPDDKI